MTGQDPPHGCWGNSRPGPHRLVRACPEDVTSRCCIAVEPDTRFLQRRGHLKTGPDGEWQRDR